MKVFSRQSDQATPHNEMELRIFYSWYTMDMSLRLASGLAMILLGVLLLLDNLVPLSASFALLAAGTIFLLVYFAAGIYGFLIPGSLLIGLAVALLVQSQIEQRGSGGLFIVCLGGGFLFIYILDRFRRPTFSWPLVPGGILLGFGGLMFLRDYQWISPEQFARIFRFWPVILILLGIYFICKRRA